MAAFIFKLNGASTAFLTSQWRNLREWLNYAVAKLRHRDVKNALLAPWSLKTNAAYVLSA